MLPHRQRAGGAAARNVEVLEEAEDGFLLLLLDPRARVLTLGKAVEPMDRVRGEGRAERRFPLDRLSRVVASARLNWSGDALRACLERAIPVVLVSADGSPLGSVQPARPRPSRLAEALEELLEWPNWRDIYCCWLRAARMRVLADWRRAQQAAGAAPGERDYHELVKRHVYGGKPPLPMHGMAELWRGAVYALATQTIERWRLSGLMWGSGGEALDLRNDCEFMELRLRLEVSQGAEAALKGEATILLVFCALSEKLEFEAGRAIRSLARRVNEVLAGGSS